MNSAGVGLSLTAIGMRPLRDALAIADQLRAPLGLDFLELGIGVSCHVNDDYGTWPLVLHDSCLSAGNPDRSLRCHFDLLDTATWPVYRAFVASHQVEAMSVHAPLRTRTSAAGLSDAVHRCSDYLGLPVMVEVMPEVGRWCSSAVTLVDVPLLVDVSHVHIWSCGDEVASLELVEFIIANHHVAGLHLSHNDGKSDSHDLIPEQVWFANRIDHWMKGRRVTLESLPTSLAEHRRLDQTRSRWNRQSNHSLSEPSINESAPSNSLGRSHAGTTNTDSRNTACKTSRNVA
jgi:hypothetical protein